MPEEEIEGKEEGKCPRCGSEDLEHYDLEYQGEYTIAKATCKGCGGDVWYVRKTVFERMVWYPGKEN